MSAATSAFPCLKGPRIPGNEGLQPVARGITDRMVAAGTEIERRIVGRPAVTAESEIEPLRARRAAAPWPVQGHAADLPSSTAGINNLSGGELALCLEPATEDWLRVVS